MEPLTVTRSIRIPAPADELWTSLADGKGLSGWLADLVDVEVVVGGTGVAIDGDTVRRLVVTDVEVGRSVGFVWWDEARPDIATTVSVRLDDDGDGGATVTVAERLLGGAVALVADASVADLGQVGRAWDGRLQALLGASPRLAALV